ncbi:MAG: c-type cytochrome [Terrimonas sp.]|nr:c-type cytochrome [Terrimonas sp.]
MRKNFIITVMVSAAIMMASCKDVRRSPGRYYMPDMTYSRAYETYAELDTNIFTNKTSDLGEGKIFYNALPVHGTVARGEMPEYPYKNDSLGYAMSATVVNPLPALSADEMKEAERLYLVNCGICHGPKLDGNGPLYNDGNGPYTAAPKNFMIDAMKAMPEGTMFHSVTYGKNAMGSYASQLTTKQRWEIIHYIKSKQGVGAPAAAAKDSTAMAAK